MKDDDERSQREGVVITFQPLALVEHGGNEATWQTGDGAKCPTP